MAIELTDDGTLDTVLRCSDCGEEFRYNSNADYDPEDAEDDEDADQRAYDAFIEWVIADAESEHECALDAEPQEDDLTTSDHEKYYQNGKLVLLHAANGSWYRLDMKAFPAGVLIGEFGDDHKAAIRAFMGAQNFYPNCWFISDHGNAHLMDLTEGNQS